jgi:hypothetical protein
MGSQEDALAVQTRLTVARRVIADIVEREIGDQWENYPEIGEHDWQAIQDVAIERTKELGPSDDVYHAAYDRLARRARLSSGEVVDAAATG